MYVSTPVRGVGIRPALPVCMQSILTRKPLATLRPLFCGVPLLVWLGVSSGIPGLVRLFAGSCPGVLSLSHACYLRFWRGIKTSLMGIYTSIKLDENKDRARFR